MGLVSALTADIIIKKKNFSALSFFFAVARSASVNLKYRWPFGNSQSGRTRRPKKKIL